MYKKLAMLALLFAVGCVPGRGGCPKCEAADCRCAPGSACGNRCVPCGCVAQPTLQAPASAEATAPANRLALWQSFDGGRSWQFVRWHTGQAVYATGARVGTCVGGNCFR
jgi:hypothetical protein